MIITAQEIKEFANELANILNEKFDTNNFKLVGEPKDSKNPFINNISFYLSDKEPATHNQTLVELNYTKDKGFILSIGNEGYTKWVGGLEFRETWFRGLLNDLDKESIQTSINAYYGVYGIYKNHYGLTFIKNADETEINKFIIENKLSIKEYDSTKPFNSIVKDTLDITNAIKATLYKDDEIYSLYAPEF